VTIPGDRDELQSIGEQTSGGKNRGDTETFAGVPWRDWYTFLRP
jgi:hypothetical protein